MEERNGLGMLLSGVTTYFVPLHLVYAALTISSRFVCKIFLFLSFRLMQKVNWI